MSPASKPNNNNKGQGASKGGDEKSRRRRKGSRKKKVDPQVFWGDAEKLAQHVPGRAQITADPDAVINSLGRAPLSGQQHAAEHYFVAVYDRAVNLAGALAAAGQLIDTEELLDGDRSSG